MDARMMLRAARPILWETLDKAFPYSFGDSCFLSKYEENFYIITAGHCIKDKADADHLFVERYPGGQYPLLICYLRYMRPEDPINAEDTDYTDLAIVTINKEKLDQQREAGSRRS